MPTLVHFGAGNIGRGFIGQLFSVAGWEVIFVDVQEHMLQALNERGSCTVYEGGWRYENSITVSPVRGVDGRDAAAGRGDRRRRSRVHRRRLGALPHIAKLARVLPNAWPIRAAPWMCWSVKTGCRLQTSYAAPYSNKVAMTCAYSLIVCMAWCAPQLGAWFRQEMVRIYWILRSSLIAPCPLKKQPFVGIFPILPGLKAKPDFDLVLRQKLYIHNATHACLAYAGLAKGLVSVPDCMEDSELVERMRAVGSEVSAALAAAHGSEDNPAADIEAECLAMVDDLCHRYQNRPLGDPLARVARDPVRKLSADDRLIGAARLCEQQGIKAQALAQHILLACTYAISDDEPQADLWARITRRRLKPQLAGTSHRI